MIAVEPETSQAYRQALEAGGPVEVEVGGVAADSLGAKRVGETPWATMRAHDVESVLVADEAITSSPAAPLAAGADRRRARGDGRARSAGLAAPTSPSPASASAVIVSGGNFDSTVLA